MATEIKHEMVKIIVANTEFEVPSNLTIMKALEYLGWRLDRGVGCRGGFCGACSTIYRLQGDHRLYTGLACATKVEKGMLIAQIPISPANKKQYNIEALKAEPSTMLEFYPEIARCISCNTCTKACPMDIEVMDYVQAALRGDIADAAQISFDCIMCGLCATRCPAEISQFNVGILARRLYGRYIAPKYKQIEKRVKEVEKGTYDAEIDKMMKADKNAIAKLYNARVREED
ncbi:MAG: 4Fe-4S dicluster domain-containing protein [Candidatus Heimdallarchaeota archaeon]|nr:4Fe-4S dicluster domain-containing protein [Candidatus Heimdallarchaeota archaeon]MCK5297787.1 4Fe-4S dicluster domain-containing protein [Candidatus Heimdallarchaeota archaeon]